MSGINLGAFRLETVWFFRPNVNWNGAWLKNMVASMASTPSRNALPGSIKGQAWNGQRDCI